jgi:hypothetical protein
MHGHIFPTRTATTGVDTPQKYGPIYGTTIDRMHADINKLSRTNASAKRLCINDIFSFFGFIRIAKNNEVAEGVYLITKHFLRFALTTLSRYYSPLMRFR